MKLSERIQIRAGSDTVFEPYYDVLGQWATEAAQLEAKLEAITCGECGKNLLECDTAECDRTALESGK